MSGIVWLDTDDPHMGFPEVSNALSSPDGLLAAGGDLSPERLLLAYAQGIFPWFNEGQPILWWCPDPRTVLFPGEFHASRSLARSRRRARFSTTINCDFSAVIRGCAAPRGNETGTWITPVMQVAYQNLHRLGYAHSVEVWSHEELVGGIYGVAIGRVFFGESMFSRVTDASKFALQALCTEMINRNYVVLDCQIESVHLASLGSRCIPRDDFLSLMATYCCQRPAHGAWEPLCSTDPLPAR